MNDEAAWAAAKRGRRREVPPDFIIDKALIQMHALRETIDREWWAGRVTGPAHCGEEDSG